MRAIFRYGIMLLCVCCSRVFADNALTEVLESRGRPLHVRVEFEQKTIHDPDLNLDKTLPPELLKGVEPATARTELFRGSFYYSDGRARYDLEAIGNAAPKGPPVILKWTMIRTPERSESAVQWSGQKGLIGIIADSAEIQPWHTLDLALGLRLYGKQEWITKDDWRGAELRDSPPEKIMLRLKGKGKVLHSMTFTRELGWALENVQMEFPDPEVKEEIKCSDFRIIGDMRLPFKVERQNTYRDSTGQMRHPITHVITVGSYEVADAERAREWFALRWPKGSAVLDQRTAFQMDLEESVVLSDEEIARRLQAQEAKDEKDLEGARELMKQIRQHDSPQGGDGESHPTTGKAEKSP